MGPSPLGKASTDGHPDAVERDANGLEILDRDACLLLLAQKSLGRIGITSGALPTVLPVNYRLIDGQIMFRTARGTKLAAASLNAVVAFEIDEMDAFARTGWSVVVTGIAREVEEPDADALRDLIARWAPEPDGHVVAITPELISGRRLDDVHLVDGQDGQAGRNVPPSR